MNDLLLSNYDYSLPQELIAHSPVEPKDSAKLLVYNRNDKSITHTTFASFIDFLPKDSTLIFNDTKVIKARIYGNKLHDYCKLGARVEALFHKALSDSIFLLQFKGRFKVGDIVHFDNGMFAKILKDCGGGFKEASFSKNYNFSYCMDEVEFLEFLENYGSIPLPPYIKSDSNNKEVEYNSIFARNLGAIAAPTASLHFSEESFAKLQHNFRCAFVTLHVGAGTYLGVESENILEHKMHKERFVIPQQTIDILKNSKHITAIGTTATRVIESYYRDGIVSGECDLFLNPKNKPLKTNSILTNFHLPKTTLLMLVSSFVGLSELKRIYKEAIDNRYRFYSYGDGMLVI